MNTHYQHHSFHAMGSTIQVWIEANQDDAGHAFTIVEEYFKGFECIFTRFDSNSELSTINREGGGYLSPIFYRMLKEALHWADRTNGYYDPTLLRSIEQVGYCQSFEPNQVLQMGDRSITHARYGYLDVLLNDDTQSVHLFNDVMLDLNGIVKGYTAELACNEIRSIGPCLIDAGGDVMAGDAPTDALGWLVSVAAPHDENQDETDLFAINLVNAMMATSGRDFRKWIVNDKSMHHIIDPFTGNPTQNDIATVTVVGKGAAYAEAWATAACVMGRKKASIMFEDNHVAACFNHSEGYTVTRPLQSQIIVTYS